MKWNNWPNSIVCLQVYDGAIIGSRKVFCCFERRGISIKDIAQTVVLESIRSKLALANPKGFGYVGGYRRALDVIRDSKKVKSLSELGWDSSTVETIEARSNSPETKLFLDEMMERICGDDLENDLFILSGRMHNKTYVEIASELGMEPSTVRTRFEKMKERAKPYRTDFFLDA